MSLETLALENVKDRLFKASESEDSLNEILNFVNAVFAGRLHATRAYDSVHVSGDRGPLYSLRATGPGKFKTSENHNLGAADILDYANWPDQCCEEVVAHLIKMTDRH